MGGLDGFGSRWLAGIGFGARAIARIGDHSDMQSHNHTDSRGLAETFADGAAQVSARAPSPIASHRANASPRLILASSSRYRRDLLTRLGLPFEAMAPDIDETPRAGESPRALSARLAAAKAARIFRDHADALVIGSDQVATIDDVRPLGKPGTFERARQQLRESSGRTLNFYTAWALLGPGGFRRDGVDMTRVTYRQLDDARIERYLRLEEPYDCAGSARCESLGITLLESIHSGDPTALIGLPMIALSQALLDAGVDPILIASA